MNQLPADYHMHTPLCLHAEGWPKEYAKRAVELGLDEIGFSDHSPFKERRDDWRMDKKEMDKYITEVEKARVEYPELMIRLGLEVDFLPGEESWIEELNRKYKFDYLIGSVHYLSKDWVVDDPRYVGKFDELEVSKVWDLYWEAYIKAIKSGLFDIMGHPDLVKKFGHRPDGELTQYYEGAIEAMVQVGCAYEINTAGLRKEVNEMYPHPSFLTMACEAGVPVVFGSDAHAPQEVGSDFEEAVSLAKTAGYKKTLRFDKGNKIEVSL